MPPKSVPVPMVHRPTTVEAHEPAPAAIEIMLAQAVGAVPVVAAFGLLVGIVTLIDVARVCLTLLDSALRDPEGNLVVVSAQRPHREG